LNIIDFDTRIGSQKPNSLLRGESCPFCDREHLTDIIAEENGIILLRNKYNVIVGADQFVLIEGRECQTDMPEYPKEKMRRLIAFGLHHWQKLLHCGRYEEVIFFKNFGPLSGGTIRHPHMQLVGFPKLDSSCLYLPEYFEGHLLAEKDGITMSLSDYPRVGFWELNLKASLPLTSEQPHTLADFIQISTDYFMHHFNHRCQSYNIFFYHEGDRQLMVKITPRYATSPLYIGYGIRFRPTSLKEAADAIKKLYF
jgi:galactose-1-phosphate uridylyltransferase